jgi:hypothetical protein
MFIRILKSPYTIAGIIIFLILFFVFLLGVHTRFGEAILYSAVLSAIGVFTWWWKEYIW